MKGKKKLHRPQSQTLRTSGKYVNSKRKTVSGISELHTMRDNKTFIAESDEDKAGVLSDFFSSVFTREPSSALPNIKQRDFNCKSSDEPFNRETVRKLLTSINTS